MLLLEYFLFGNILKLLINRFYIATCFAFIGLILGSIKLVIKQANLKKVTLIHILILLITLSFSIYLIALENSLDFNLNTNSNTYLIIAGFLMSLRNCYSRY